MSLFPVLLIGWEFDIRSCYEILNVGMLYIPTRSGIFISRKLTGRLLLRSKIHNLLRTILAMPPMNIDSNPLWKASITKL